LYGRIPAITLRGARGGGGSLSAACAEGSTRSARAISQRRVTPASDMRISRFV
jgi:hypothetical protein